MTTISDVARFVRKEEAQKQRLYQRSSRFVNLFAFDNIEELSARDLAKKVLAKLGIRQESDDPVRDLESYLEGREHGERERAGTRESAGMDAAGGSFIDDYINGGA